MKGLTVKSRERFRQHDKKRFQQKYPVQKIRAKTLNFIASVLETPQELLNKEIVLPNYIQIELPFSSYLSKNKYGYANTNGVFRHYTLPETSALQTQIAYLIKAKRPNFVQRKVWVEMVIQKPQLRGDAINYVDRICDAIQKAIGINDSWFSLRKVDWQIIRKDPKIIIGIGQEGLEPMKGCTMCGRVLQIDPYFSKPNKPESKPYLTCKSCRSKDIESIKL